MPSQVGSGPAADSPPDWAPLLSAAGLDPTSLTAVPPDWLPPTGFDSRAAWDGVLGAEKVHVVAAAYHGSPVYFRVVAPWGTRPESMPALPAAASTRISRLAYWFIGGVLVLIAALFLARRNLRLGRGDRKNAARIGVVMFFAYLTNWLFDSHHVADPAEVPNFITSIGASLYYAAYVYLGYLALEPYVRRRWPGMLVSWTRGLAGRFADPRVGRDLLAGCLAGVSVALVVITVRALSLWFNLSGQVPSYPVAGGYGLRGWGGAIAMIADALIFALIYGLGGIVVLLMARLAARRTDLAIILFVIVSGLISFPRFGAISNVAIPLALVVNSIYVMVLFRFGILALVAAQFTVLLLNNCLLIADPSRWYFWPTAIALGITAGMAAFGFRSALAGRPAFGRALLED